MQYKSRLEVLKGVLYPVYKNQSLFDSVHEGTVIPDWSPNNLRRVIISEKMVYAEWYINAARNPKNYAQFSDEIIQQVVSGVDTDCLSDLIFKHNFGRQFSNIEEVIFCDYNNEQVLLTDVQNLRNGTYNLEAYKHLFCVSYFNNISFGEAVELIKDRGYGQLLTPELSKKDTCNVIYQAKNRTVTEIRTDIRTNSGMYLIDAQLKSRLDELEDKFQQQQSNKKQQSVKLTQSKLNVIAKKVPDGFNSTYQTMADDTSKLINAIQSNTFSRRAISYTTMQAQTNYSSALGDIAKDILLTIKDKAVINSKDACFGRGVTADDTKQQHPLLVALETICNYIKISFGVVTDQNLEVVLGVTLNIARSVLLSNMLVTTYKDKLNTIDNLIVTKCDTSCIKLVSKEFGVSDADWQELISRLQSVNNDMLAVTAKGKDKDGNSKEVLLCWTYNKLLSLPSYVDDTDGETDNTDEDEEYEETDNTDEDEDTGEEEVYEDEDDTGEDDDTEETDTNVGDSTETTESSGGTYSDLIQYINTRYSTLINPTKFKSVVQERLKTADDNQDFQEVYVISFYYLVLYKRINQVVRVARPMVQLMIQSQITSQLTYDDQNIEILNKYADLTDTHISSATSLSFATKVTVDKNKSNRGNLINTLKNIVEKVVG